MNNAAIPERFSRPLKKAQTGQEACPTPLQAPDFGSWDRRPRLSSALTAAFSSGQMEPLSTDFAKMSPQRQRD